MAMFDILCGYLPKKAKVTVSVKDLEDLFKQQLIDSYRNLRMSVEINEKTGQISSILFDKEDYYEGIESCPDKTVPIVTLLNKIKTDHMYEDERSEKSRNILNEIIEKWELLEKTLYEEK